MTIFNMSFILEDIFQEVLVLLSVEFCSDRKLNHWKILLIVSGLVLDFSRARIIWCVLFSICDFFFFTLFGVSFRNISWMPEALRALSSLHVLELRCLLVLIDIWYLHSPLYPQKPFLLASWNFILHASNPALCKYLIRTFTQTWAPSLIHLLSL